MVTTYESNDMASLGDYCIDELSRMYVAGLFLTHEQIYRLLEEVPHKKTYKNEIWRMFSMGVSDDERDSYWTLTIERKTEIASKVRLSQNALLSLTDADIVYLAFIPHLRQKLVPGHPRLYGRRACFHDDFCEVRIGEDVPNPWSEFTRDWSTLCAKEKRTFVERQFRRYTFFWYVASPAWYRAMALFANQYGSMDSDVFDEFPAHLTSVKLLYEPDLDNPGPTASEIFEINQFLFKLETLTQKFNSVPLRAQGMYETVRNLVDLPNLTTDMISRFCRIAERLEKFLADPMSSPQLASFLQGIVIPTCVQDVISLVPMLIMILLSILVFATRKWFLVAPFIVCMGAYLRVDKVLLTHLQELIKKPLEAQSGDESSYVPALGKIMFAILSFGCVGIVPKLQWYDKLLRRLDLIPKAIVGAGKIWDLSGKIFQIVSDEYKIRFLGEERSKIDPTYDLLTDIDKWSERVQHYMHVERQSDLQLDPNALTEIMEMYSKMYEWRSLKFWNTIPQCGKIVIQNYLNPMTKLFEQICKSHAINGGTRTPPTTILFSGETGVGKSDLLTPFITRVLHEARGLKGKELQTQIYARNYETDFWDGYHGQMVVVVDDAFQRRDSPSNPSPEFMEAIRMANSAAFMVHMADLQDKGTFFNSEFVVYNTNLMGNPTRLISSIICPEAVVRRIAELAFRVMPHKDYAMEVEFEGKKKMRLDTEKISKCPHCAIDSERLGFKLPWCKHCLHFVQYDLLTDEITREGIDFDEMVNIVVEYDKKYFHQQSTKTDFYDRLFEDPSLTRTVSSVSRVENELVVDLPPLSKDSPKHKDVDWSKLIAQMDDEELSDDEELLEDAEFDLALDMTNEEEREAAFFFKYSKQYLTEKQELDKIWMLEFSKYHYLLGRYHHFGIAMDVQAELLSIQKQQQIKAEVQDLFSAGWLRKKFMVARKTIATKLMDAVDAAKMKYQESKLFRVSAIIGGAILMAGILVEATLLLSSFYTGKKNEGSEIDSESVPEDSQFESGPKILSEASSSGPIVQKSIARVKTESSSSGPVVQKSIARVKTESSSSGPLIVTRPSAVQVESSSSAVLSPRFIPVVKTEMEDEVDSYMRQNVDTLRAQGVIDQNAYDVLAKVVQSLYCMHTDVKIIGNVLFVRGTIALMPYHFVSVMRSNPEVYPRERILSLSSYVGDSMIQCTIGYLLDNARQLVKNGHNLDACLVAFDNVLTKVHIHQNLLHMFISQSVITMLNGNYRAFLPTYGLVSNLKKSLFRLAMKECVDVSGRFDVNVPSQEIECRAGVYRTRLFWEYISITSEGDCGAPCVIFETALQHKLVGIHIAGGADGYGISQIITQEILQQGMEGIPARAQMYCEYDVDQFVAFEEQYESVPNHKGIKVVGMVVKEKRLKSGGRTKITPSPLYNKIAPALTKPAMMRAFGEIDPMEKGVVKYGKNFSMVDPKKLMQVKEDIRNLLNVNVKSLDKSKYAEVLTYEQAVLGDDFDEYMAPINRTTSAGYPYSLIPNLMRGKQSIFGTEEWTLDNELAKRVENDVTNLIWDCRWGVQRNVYWSDTLKDERRPIAKVDAGKTRVFCGSPLHYTIGFRRYFLGFAAWMMQNRNFNECSPGTDPYGLDWDIIAKLMRTTGFSQTNGRTLVMAGDYENFDGSLLSQVLWIICDLINEWYGGSDMDTNIRLGLWNHIVHSMHINGGVVYQLTHSQPSGCPLTAVLNSVYNSFVVRLGYLYAAEAAGMNSLGSMKYFNRYVKMVSYGDDNLIAVSPDIQEWFNQETLTKALAVIGHVYTDESKSGNLVIMRSLDEIKYLKRSFHFDNELQRYVAPLDLDVIMEIPQWTKAGLCSLDITRANVDVAMRELSLHPRQVFEEKAGIIREEAYKARLGYNFLDYWSYKNEVCGQGAYETKHLSSEMGVVTKSSAKPTTTVVREGDVNFQKLKPHVLRAFAKTRRKCFVYKDGKNTIVIRRG